MDSTHPNMKYWPQIAGAFIVSFVWLTMGGLIGFTTVALPQLQNNDSLVDIYIDDEQASWFAAIPLITGIPIAPFGGFLGGLVGRRNIMLYTHPFVIIGLIVVANASNFAVLLIGRMIISASLCCHVSSVGVYIAETVHPSIRNNLTIIPSIFMSAGFLFTWVIGYFETWRNTAYILTIPSIMVSLCLIALPESPYWLVEAQKIDLAKKSLQFFRGSGYDITEEINEMEEKHEYYKKASEGTRKAPIFKSILSLSFLKPFSCVGVLFITAEFSGYQAFMSYMFKVLKHSGFTLDLGLGPIIVGCIRLFVAGLIPLIVGRVKPKVLFVISQTITTLALITICIYSFINELSHVQDVDDENVLNSAPTVSLDISYVNGTIIVEDSNINDQSLIKTFNWIPLAAIVVINVIRGAGIEPVLHILTNEMFPMAIRTLSIGITQSAFLISGFVSVKIFPTLENAMGLGYVCVMYSFICFLVILWGLFTIPDNRGKSLAKVEESARKMRPLFCNYSIHAPRNIMMSTLAIADRAEKIIEKV